MGQVQLQDQGRPAEALHSFEIYLRVHPTGSLVEEAEWGLVGALRSQGNFKQEREALERFLRRFSRSPHGAQAKRRFDSLSKE